MENFESSKLLEAALTYLRQSWSVIPLFSRTPAGQCTCGNGSCPKPGKHPRIAWKKYQETRPTETEAKSWWQRWPQANVGIVLGKVSGGLAVLDIDHPALANRVTQEKLPTRVVRSPRGGAHIYLLETDAISNSGPLIGGVADFKANGGFVVTAPSPGYEVIQDGVPLIVPDGRRWALESLAVWGVKVEEPAPSRRGYETLRDGPVKEGVRNETLTSLSGLLRTKGFDEMTVQTILESVNEKRCQPPLGSTEVQAIARSVGRYSLKEQRYLPDALRKVSPEWPEPPDEAAYHGLAGEIVRAISPHSESDPVGLLVQLLVAVGNVIGKEPYFLVEATRHYTNLDVVSVGKTSRARKGTSLRHVLRLLETIDPLWSKNCIKSGLSSGEGLIWQIRDTIVKEKGGRTVVEDEGVEDKRLLVIQEEFSSILKVMGRQGNTLSPVLRDAWDGVNLSSLTKNSPARATSPHVSVIGHVTKDELIRYFDSTEAANGFGNRFLWLCVKRSQVLPEGGQIQQVDFASLIKRLAQAVDFARTVGQMGRDEETRTIWNQVYSELTRDVPGLLGAVMARGEAQVVRLSCLYALLDLSSVVRAVHLKAGLAVWGYCERSAQYVFGDSLGYPMADSILRALRATPEGLSRTDIQNLFSRNYGAGEINRALGFLLEQGSAKRRSEQTDGRPTERWFAA